MDELEIAEIKSSLERLLMMLNDPHPGLSSWVQMYWEEREMLLRKLGVET